MDPLPLSLLNDYLFCPRRAALKVVEGWREENTHTVRGDIVHEHSDLAGYEVVEGVRLIRALPVWSERLGLSGKCDIVEVHAALTLDPSPIGWERGRGVAMTVDSSIPERGTLCPVEFKVGKRRRWENDDVQLCAQALCLEEMLQCSIPRGAVYHAETKRRRPVEFTSELRALTEKAAAELHRLACEGKIPQAILKEACSECSLH